ARPLLDEGLALTRAAGTAWSEAVILAERAALARDEDELELVEALAIQGVQLLRAQGSRWYLPECLELLGGAASARARPERAARLFGAAEGARTTAGVTALPVDQAVVARQVAAARAALGETTFAAA